MTQKHYTTHTGQELLLIEVPTHSYNINLSNKTLTPANYIFFDVCHFGRYLPKKERGTQTIDIPPGKWQLLGKANESTDLHEAILSLGLNPETTVVLKKQ